MANISIGGTHDNSKLVLDVSLLTKSQMTLTVGDSYDMSSRQITIVERESDAIEKEIDNIVSTAAKVVNANPADPASKRVGSEAANVVAAAKKVLTERKWYSVSVEGLIEAAKAVGTVASPIVASAVKVIELLKEAEAQLS